MGQQGGGGRGEVGCVCVGAGGQRVQETKLDLNWASTFGAFELDNWLTAIVVHLPV